MTLSGWTLWKQHEGRLPGKSAGDLAFQDLYFPAKGGEATMVFLCFVKSGWKAGSWA